MNANQIVVDVPKTIGSKIWLHSVRENKIYKDGKPTGETDGYRYEVFCIERKMLPLSVKIPGKLLIAEPENGYVQVEFTELELTPYVMNNQINFTAAAKSVAVVKDNN
ncbi:MAG: hypothetical protein LBD23_13275 [Oscillospiraceae bacterium]|nr:hypothetical protein [Oscillospiraceae bacterium]